MGTGDLPCEFSISIGQLPQPAVVRAARGFRILSVFTDKHAKSKCAIALHKIALGAPGLDKDAFYAAALYLHAARGELNVNPLRPPTQTPEATREFLDHLADCFARSKLKDARDHVSATAMTRNEEEKTITLYIAKNQTEKGCQPFASGEEVVEMRKQNEVFADKLIGKWFNKWATEEAHHADDANSDDLFKIMCLFNSSRLEYYIHKLSESDAKFLETIVSVNLANKDYAEGWKSAESLLHDCSNYNDKKSKSSHGNIVEFLIACAKLAGQTRKHSSFRSLHDRVRESPSTERPKLEPLIDTVKWIYHLGRLWAALSSFRAFCKQEKQKGYSFKYVLLQSKEDDWNGHAYLEKVRSWRRYLNLAAKHGGKSFPPDMTVEEVAAEVVKTTGDKARVHCEMLLLMHFSDPSVEKCLDYFGCSKKSCWLCWQMILKNYKYSMKDTHRKIFPRWAFPLEFSESQSAMADGLRTACHEMLSLIQDHIIKKTPLDNLEPYPQTSARMTPAYARPRTISDVGHELTPSPLLANPMIVPDRLPPSLVRVAALHFPEDSRTIRQVEIDAFEPNMSNVTEQGMVPTNFSGKDIVFAFQLITSAELSFPSDIDDIRKDRWEATYVRTAEDIAWRMFHQPNADGLGENPTVFEIWKEIYGTPPVFPWRGNIFILAEVPDKDLLKAPSNLDASECLNSLREFFEHMGAKFAIKEQEEKCTEGHEFWQKMMEHEERRQRGQRVLARFKRRELSS